MVFGPLIIPWSDGLVKGFISLCRGVNCSVYPLSSLTPSGRTGAVTRVFKHCHDITATSIARSRKTVCTSLIFDRWKIIPSTFLWSMRWTSKFKLTQDSELIPLRSGNEIISESPMGARKVISIALTYSKCIMYGINVKQTGTRHSVAYSVCYATNVDKITLMIK